MNMSPFATDRMSVAVFIAVVCHAVVVLGVSFEHELPPLPRLNSLDIVLVHSRTEAPVEDATHLAQVNNDGGGESDPNELPATPIPTPFLAPSAELVAAAPPPPALPVPRPARVDEPSESRVDSERVPLLTHSAAVTTEKVQPAARPRPRRKPRRLAVAQAAIPPATIEEQVPRLHASRLISRALALASLSAEVDRKLTAYAERPRRKWVSARTREVKYASYMEAWRAKVERIGNLNYPDEARRRSLSGKLVLDVAIRPDGSLKSVTVKRSSGHTVLDDAAVRIVRLAAPYAAFPNSFKDEIDILHIERTWRFLASNRLAAR
jgi:periplasmic protein TonB